MDIHIALMATASAMALTAALLLGAYGRRQGPQLHHGGLLWWKLAPAMVAAGAAVGALWSGSGGSLLATMLLLAWPPLTLVGLRRFHARQRLPGHEFLDLALLALAWAALLLTALVDPALVGHTGAAAALALGLYVAAVVVGALGARTGESSDTRLAAADGGLSAPAPLLTLALAMALGGFLSVLPSLRALVSGPGLVGAPSTPWSEAAAEALLAQSLAAALGAVVTAFTVQWLLAERSERQLRDSRRRLRALANQDALTQVPNRRHFRDLASHALRHDTPGSAVLLIFDIDHFKRINDEGGHAAGDRALCLVSSCMVEHLRTADVAGRHGGDEFVLLLRQAGTADAMRVAGRIVSAIQVRSPALQLPVLTLSFGMVQVGVAEPLDEALRRADQALYEAKRQGRSRAVAAQGDELEPVFSESRRLGLTAL
jgi:diguanylate cyclase